MFKNVIFLFLSESKPKTTFTLAEQWNNCFLQILATIKELMCLTRRQDAVQLVTAGGECLPEDVTSCSEIKSSILRHINS